MQRASSPSAKDTMYILWKELDREQPERRSEKGGLLEPLHGHNTYCSSDAQFLQVLYPFSCKEDRTCCFWSRAKRSVGVFALGVA